jgi:hypothetical protein
VTKLRNKLFRVEFQRALSTNVTVLSSRLFSVFLLNTFTATVRWRCSEGSVWNNTYSGLNTLSRSLPSNVNKCHVREDTCYTLFGMWLVVHSADEKYLAPVSRSWREEMLQWPRRGDARTASAEDTSCPRESVRDMQNAFQCRRSSIKLTGQGLKFKEVATPHWCIWMIGVIVSALVVRHCPYKLGSCCHKHGWSCVVSCREAARRENRPPAKPRLMQHRHRTIWDNLLVFLEGWNVNVL